MSPAVEYIPLDQYDGAWMFADLTQRDRAEVRPLTRRSSTEVWQRFVSRRNRHPMLLAPDEWPSQPATWQHRGRWEGAGGALPEVLGQLPWADVDRVYYAPMKERVIETSWAVFKNCWHNFVFRDHEAALLIHPERLEVACFGPHETVDLGRRPAEL